MSDLSNLETALPNGAQPVTGGALLRAAIARAFNEYETDADKATAARDASKRAAETGLSRKESVISAAAQHAHAGKWDSAEIESAVKTETKARKDGGAKSAAALTQFGSELRRFLAPAVRPYVAVYFKIAREAVDNETALKAVDSDASTPVTKAFSKPYHAAFNLAKHVADKHDGANYTSAADIQMFAVAWLRARDINADRVLKQLKKITDTLRAFNTDFDLEALSDCIETMGNIRKEDIEGALVTVPVTVAPTPTPTVAPPAPAPMPETETSDVDQLVEDALAA